MSLTLLCGMVVVVVLVLCTFPFVGVTCNAIAKKINEPCCLPNLLTTKKWVVEVNSNQVTILVLKNFGQKTRDGTGRDRPVPCPVPGLIFAVVPSREPSRVTSCVPGTVPGIASKKPGQPGQNF